MVIWNHGRRSRMLILTRNKNESVIIDDDIKLTDLNDPYGQVKPGIEAPGDVEIWREEIYETLLECDSASCHSNTKGSFTSYPDSGTPWERLCG
jgi:carbon storage regulator